jgi:hypothetical protein
MKFIYCTLLASLLFSAVMAQEIKVNVTINTPKLQTADPKVFQSLKTSIEEFINNQKWTEDAFEQEERITCNIQLTITKEFSSNSFGAEMQIQALRPVYGGTYETAIITHSDKDITFTYEQFQPIIYSRDGYTDNLSSVLAFYSYLIMGLDYDSFSPFGGDYHFQQCRDIISKLPQSISDADGSGWNNKTQRNRYWMVENLQNPRIRPLRQAFYDYHIRGLDVMFRDPVGGRATIFKAIEELEKVNVAMPSSMIVQMFTNSKSNEIVDIFKQGTPQEKARVNQIMTKLDPANSNKYRQIGF